MKIKSAEFVKGAVKPSDYPMPSLPQVAFAGRSNVGKSSLINSLLNRKRLARTSRTPGRTQQINFFILNGEIYFVDLPGYGYAKVPKRIKKNWDKMIVSYLRDNPALKLLIAILDARRKPSDLDLRLQEWILGYQIPFIYAVTKSDKLSKNQLHHQLKVIKETLAPPEGVCFLPYSAKTRRGRRELLDVVDMALEGTQE